MLARRTFPELSPELNQWLSTVTDSLNSIAGYNGPAYVNDHLSIEGNRLMNVGTPVSSTDAISSGHAESKYSASSLQPQLEIGGSAPLNSYRVLNSRAQQEQYSSHLNSLMSAVGNANTIVPTVSTSGGSSTITIPASIFQYSDGSKKYFPGRSDTVSNPASFTISTWSVTAGVATVNTTATNTVALNGSVTITGSGGIDGTWPVVGVASGTQFTISVPFGNNTGLGGTVATGSVFYYTAIRNNPILQINSVPSTSDTPYNRLPISNDQKQLVCIVTLNSSGSVSGGSAGGGTPTNAANGGSFF